MTNYSEPEWPHQGGQPPQQQPGGPFGPQPGGHPGYGQSPYRQPPWDQPSYDQPQYGPPSYDQPEYEQPSYGQPQYGQPSYGQPQYGQPQDGQPGGFPPGPGGARGPGYGPYGTPPPRNKTPWIIGGITAVVAVGLAVALILTIGGSNDSSAGAEGAVDVLLKADVNKDLKAAQNVTCDPLHSEIDQSFVQNPDKSYTIGRATQNGDTATVASTIVDSQNASHNVVFAVRKQSGAWKVCDVSEARPGGGNAPSGGGSVPTPSVPGGGTGSLCITPDGSTPICIPN